MIYKGDFLCPAPPPGGGVGPKRAQFDLSEIIWLYAGRRLEISGYFLNLR